MQASRDTFLKHSMFTVTEKVKIDEKTSDLPTIIDESNSNESSEYSLETIALNMYVQPPKQYENFKDLLSSNTIEQKYGCILMNYFYEMQIPTAIANDIENIFLFPETDDTVQEVSEKSIHISSCQVFVNTKLYHAMEWLLTLLMTPLPQRKGKAALLLLSFYYFYPKI